jgi:hypothetical protein
MWKWLRLDPNQVANNTYAALPGAVLVALILLILTWVAGLIEAVPAAILLPTTVLSFFGLIAFLLLIIDHFSRAESRRMHPPDVATIRDWFFKRGFSITDIQNAETDFAFEVGDGSPRVVVIAKFRNDPYFLVAQSSLSVKDIPWDNFKIGTQQAIFDTLQLAYIQMGIGSFMKKSGEITIESRIPADDPSAQWMTLDRAMKVRQALLMADIIIKRTLQGASLSGDPVRVGAKLKSREGAG